MKEFDHVDGQRWRAEVISHGNTSAYLNRRVHRPIIQFTPASGRAPARYAGLPVGGPELIEEFSDQEIRDLFARSAAH